MTDENLAVPTSVLAVESKGLGFSNKGLGFPKYEECHDTTTNLVVFNDSSLVL